MLFNKLIQRSLLHNIKKTDDYRQNLKNKKDGGD